jgi:Restriction endonuclease
MMQTPVLTWQEYQTLASASFEAMGCSVAVDGRLQGARSAHDIDVVVRFTRWGIDQLWIVECKHQRRKVTKSAVETLKSIVSDVGADKGFLLSESGFQPAATASADKTSLSLLTLRDLQDRAAPDIRSSLLSQLEVRAISMTVIARDLHLSADYGSSGKCFRLRPGVDPAGGEAALGIAVMLNTALMESKVGHFDSVLPRAFPPKGAGYVKVSSLDQLLQEGLRLLGAMDTWLATQQVRVGRAERLLARLSSSPARTNAA